jgi:hypothetical protein
VLVNAGGNLAPGASAGTLTFNLGTGVLNLSSVASGGFKFELNTPTTSDKVVVSNAATTLNLGALEFSDFAFTDLGGVAAGTYTLFDAQAAFAATLGTASGSLSGFNATLVLDNTNFDLLLNVTAGGSNLGDFNNDGKVDAADYVVWRETMGTDVAKYNEWRGAFGNVYFGSGSATASGGGAVPEPATWLLVVLSTMLMFWPGRRAWRLQLAR